MNVSLQKRHVTIIGGGVLGCATAYVFARAGLNVTLFERDAIGAHASTHNAGNLNPLHGTPPSLIPFTLACLNFHKTIYQELINLKCAHYVLSASDRVHIGFDEDQRLSLEKIMHLFNNHDGFSAQWLDAPSLHQLEPRLAADILWGVLTKGNFTVDSGALTASLAEGAIALGATVISENVIDIVKSGDAVSGIKTIHGITGCDDVVFATGPWVSDINSWLDINVPIEPVKGELLLMRLAGKPLQYDVTWKEYSLYNRRDNEVWVGGTFERGGFDTTPTLAAKEHMLNQVARIMPGIKEATQLNHIVGLRPIADSGLPVIGRAKDWQNVYIVNGGGSKGVLLSTGIAHAVYDLMMHDHTSLPIEYSVF
jgi:glycine oxidase